VANSESVRKHLIRRSIQAEKIHVIYNGVDLERFAGANGDHKASLQKFGLPTGENIRFVTMVANLRHSVKNVPMLLRTAKLVVLGRPNAHFVIAGEGELEAELRELAKTLDVAENVHFIGRCTQLPALLAASDACVLTSLAEGFSNSILEYMAAGKPVVATNVGGAVEAIAHDKSGYLVASDDDEAMSQHLIELLADGEKARQMGETGRAVAAAKFSTGAQLAKTLKLYGECLSN
jgi:glycosyltransferase involved in cell wall biosynthesis